MKDKKQSYYKTNQSNFLRDYPRLNIELKSNGFLPLHDDINCFNFNKNRPIRTKKEKIKFYKKIKFVLLVFIIAICKYKRNSRK